MSDQGILPHCLKLPDYTPLAVKAYRRRFVSPAKSKNTAGPGEDVEIYPDTSTPSSFLSTKSVYLMADLQIYNAIATVDYANFGVGGAWGAIIEKLECVNQGTSLETIDNYGIVASLMANLEGAYDMETTMYFCSKLRTGFQEQFHKNFIKPPMVSGDRNIMFGMNPLGLGIDPEIPFQSQYSSTGAGGFASGQLRSSYNRADTFSINPRVNTIGSVGGILGFVNADTLNCVPTWAEPSSSVTPNAKDLRSGTTPMDWPDFFDPNSVEIVDRYVKEFGSINKVQVMANLCNVKCFPIGCIPARNPYNDKDYGIPTDQYDDTKAAVTVPTGVATAPTPSNPVYRICARVHSGIVGMEASKDLATNLLAPSQFFVRFRTAQVYHALQLTSDPCRRIVGTVRDYVRNIGQANGCYWGDTTFTVQAGAGNIYNYDASAYAPGYGPWNSVPIVKGTEAVNGAINSVFNAASCSGSKIYTTEFLPQATAPTITTAATGGSIAAGVYQYMVTYAYASGAEGPIGSSFAITTTGGTSTNTITDVPIGPLGVVKRNIYRTKVGTITPYFLQQEIANNTATTGVDDTDADASLGAEYTSAANGLTVDGRVSAIPPTPQYMLAKDPWKWNAVSGASSSAVTYAVDTEMFYGSRLTASVPQCRRILDFTYTGAAAQSSSGYQTGTATDSNQSITYQLTNMALVGDIITLPDRITADILEYAATGMYNVHTETYTTYQTTINAGAQQSIILPVKANAAKKMFIIFQESSQRDSSTAWYYDSFCGLNPFALVDPGASNSYASYSGYNSSKPTENVTLTGCGVTTKPNITPSYTDASQGFSVQLQIGSDYWPQQPLTTLQEMLVEFVKSLGKWSDNFYSPNVDNRVVPYMSSNSVAKTAYDILQPGKFATAFVPYELLDDQTILANYDMVPMYSHANVSAGVNGDAGAATGILNTASTTAANGYNWLCPRGYTVPLFTPPSSRFALTFNFDSFPDSWNTNGYMYLGNNTITLNLKGAVGLQGYKFGSTGFRQYTIYTIIWQNAVMRYSSGGQLVFVK